MAFKKIGENLSFSPQTNLLSAKEALADEEIAKRFVKLAKKIKRIAPKANDFLYGHAIQMHAAEACLVDQNTGEPILNKKKEPIRGWFDNIKVKGEDSVKWNSPDNILPYKNANGDIFPESELIKACKNWIGKPLCKDHKSDSVDGIRGIIIDTYYDPKFKRVHALFALDKKNYPDLARKVETGYANCVSMGTAVGRSVCTECSHVARTEKDYCSHIKARTNYGEVNLDLNPIELSLVVNGADGLAKIRNIVASLQNYTQEKQSRVDELVNNACVNPTELQSLSDNINEIQTKLNALMSIEKVALNTSEVNLDTEELDIKSLVGLLKLVDDPALKTKVEEILKSKFGLESKKDEVSAPLPATGGGSEPSVSPMAGGLGDTYRTTTTPISMEPSQRLASKIEGDNSLGAFSNELSLLRSKIDRLNKSFNELKTIVSKEDENMNSARLRARAKARRAYWLGGGGINEPTPGKPKYEKEDADSIRDKEDKQMVGEPLDTGSEGLHPGDEGKSWETRMNSGKGGKKADLKERQMKREALLNEVVGKSSTLSDEELKQRSMKRHAYWLGGGGINEPTPGKPKYEKEDADSIRDKEDKHMTGTYELGGTEDMVPGDEQVKKKWLRARLRARFTKVADDSGNLVKEASRWDIYAGDKIVLSATGEEIFGDQLDDNWDYLSTKAYGKDVIRYIRSEGFDRVAYLLKGAQDPLAPAPAAAPGGADLLGGLDAAAPAPASEPAPAPEAKKDDGLKGKVETGLTKIESALEDIRKAVDEGGEKLVDIEVKVDDEQKKSGPSPMEAALANFKQEALEVSALLDESADELALISEALDKSLESEAKGKLLVAASQALGDSEQILAQAEVVLAKKKKKEDKKDDEDKEDKEDKEDTKKEAAKKKKKDDDKEDKEDKKEKEDKDEEDMKKDAAKKKKKDEDKEDKKEKEDKDEKEEKSDSEKKAAALLTDALRLRSENRVALLAKAMGLQGVDYALSNSDEQSLMKLLQQERQEKDDVGTLMHPDLADDKEDKKDEEDKEEKEDKKDKKSKKEDKEDDALGMEGCACDGASYGMHAEDCAMGGVPDLAVDEALDSVVAARKAEREQLLAKAESVLGKYELDLGTAENATEPTYFLAHPGGKGTVTELTHTKTPEAKVETLSEVHDVMRDVAESGPRNVREAAMAIQEAIVKGSMKVEDIDRLVAEGKVDSAAASYWKKFWAQASEAGSFGADMSKEFAGKKKEADNQNYKTKLRRAYVVGLEAQEKGLITSTTNALETYVDQIMHFDDAAFESNKRVVANYNSVKRGGSLPRVGTDGAAEPITATASETPSELSLNDQLSRLTWR